MTIRERVRHRSRLRSKVGIAILVVTLATVTSLGAIIIPLYTYPGVDWNAIVAAKEANPAVGMVAIINPDNGPGQGRDQNYVNGVNELVAAGVVVIGYDHTSFAARSLSAVEADMNSYKAWYNVSGFFFDEMSNVQGNENYYSTLNQYAQSLGMPFTVGNPGTSVPAGYIGTLDVIVTYENQGVPNSTSLASMTAGLPKDDFAVIAYGVNSFNATAVGDVLNYASYVYVTGNTQPNPYGALTGDFSKLVSLLSNLAHTPATVTLTIDSVNSAGTPIVGLWTVIKTADGGAVASGYTPLTYSVPSDSGYVVSVADFGDFTFSHWSSGSTNPSTPVTPTQSTTLTAYYGSNTPTSSQSTTTSNSTSPSVGPSSPVTVQSAAFNGLPLAGPWAVLTLPGDALVVSGDTPLSFNATDGAIYAASMSDYGCFTFVHWEDGNTSPTFSFSASQPTTLTAVYASNFACALWGTNHPVA